MRMKKKRPATGMRLVVTAYRSEERYPAYYVRRGGKLYLLEAPYDELKDPETPQADQKVLTEPGWLPGAPACSWSSST